MRLISCTSCGQHFRADDSACPHCGEAVRVAFAPSAMAQLVLLGLALTGCPSDDDTTDTANDGTSSATLTTTATTSEGTSSTGIETSATMSEVTSIGEDSAYGTPDTGITQTDTSSDGTSSSGDPDSSSSSGTDTGTDSGSSSSSDSAGEPDYGVPESG
ncbi:MAG TPA: hypothetical protein VG755_15255 [Nannocystaceae bacterium]|nr:hypothetical protein [Nannocystaceae bacterium]